MLGLYPRDGQQQVLLNVDGGENQPTIRVAFALPPKREETLPPVDVTPQGPPDYSLPALPKPPQRARTPFGALWEEPDPKGWIK